MIDKVVDIIKKNNCDFLAPVDELKIVEAETVLNIKLSHPIREYISRFGALSYCSHELNGLGTDSYLNIVKSTQYSRNYIKNFPTNLVVIENTGIDGILILADENDTIYEWNGNGCKVIYKSFYDFLTKEIFNQN